MTNKRKNNKYVRVNEVPISERFTATLVSQFARPWREILYARTRRASYIPVRIAPSTQATSTRTERQKLKADYAAMCPSRGARRPPRDRTILRFAGKRFDHDSGQWTWQ